MKKEKKNYMNLFVIGILLIAQQSVFAQRDTSLIAKQKLNEVVVSATRTEKNVLDVGRSITVISSQEIHNSIYNSVAELLSQQEGIYIVGTGQNPGSNQSIFMRGADNNQTTVMIDGVRITDPSTVDDAIDLSELSLANVDHIEIVRGSQSTLYGSSAIGGVINIITKNNFSKDFHVDASEDAGTFGNQTSTFRENAFLNYTFQNGFYVESGINRWDVQGLNSTVDTVTHPLPYQQNPDRDNYVKTEMTGTVGFKNAKWNVSASYKYLISGAGIDAGAYTNANKDTLIFTRKSYNYNASYKFSDHFKIQFNGGISNVQRKEIQDTTIDFKYGTPEYSNEIYKGTSATNEFQLQYDLKNISLIAGGGMYNETMTSSGIYDSDGFISTNNIDSLNAHQNITYEYAQADINGKCINEKLKDFNLIIGGRFNNQNTYGNNLSYELNPSYKLSEHSLLYASYSTGFNAPSLYELYSPIDVALSSSINMGDKNLQAETSQSFEVGIKHDFGNHTHFTATWFNTVVQNSIQYVYLWNSKKPIDSLSYLDFIGDTYVNAGTQTNTGFEFTITSELSKKIFFSANMSVVNGTLQYDPASISKEQTQDNYVQLFDGGAFLTQKTNTFGLLRRPENNANIAMTYKPIEKLILRMDIHMVGSRTDAVYEGNLGPYGALGTTDVAAYTLVDFNAKYNFCKYFSAGFRMENIFNTPYSEINGYTTRGRGEYVNLRYNF
ncbi:MAG: TonB-dependent receptor [Bacteroidia bacterium]